MSSLIKSQLVIAGVMCCGGLAAGICMELFERYIAVRKPGRFRESAVRILCYAFIGVLASEFFYFCDNGKITIEGICAFLIGLWLWKNFFYGILTPMEAEDVEKKGRDKFV